MQVEDVGKSEGCIVTMQIQVSIWHESELTSDWSSVAREFEELYHLKTKVMEQILL